MLSARRSALHRSAATARAQVLPGVARWVALAHARMAAQPQILGASCQGQTTIAKIGFQRRQV